MSDVIKQWDPVCLGHSSKSSIKSQALGPVSQKNLKSDRNRKYISGAKMRFRKKSQYHDYECFRT